ncbi:DUF2799 domain-containing protein [Exilibacterium tricleocarpae]|uniref:DUF2799 domain-containing protein n=1 Tax=Exilibacterium tricleocarpae TaxID=2591008 RepID=A0A545TNT3_9GAMM|nr:DUF2799 domain-containing protein [Exilibacterium tricleocarpae]TQV78880.1 DUF2799 domain-containing protein [Exilibacterium tricleocarpae]
MISKNGSIISILLAAALLGGCATMNRSECLSADWRMIGMEDGTRGATADRLGEHRQACAEYGVTPDLFAYQQGREEGLENYCQGASGFYHGKAGHSYKGVCPNYLEGEFLAGYEQGRDLYRIDRDIADIGDTISQRRHKIERLRDRVADKEKALIHDDTDKDQRHALLHDIKKLERRIGHLRGDIYDLEYRRQQLEADYRSLEARVYF